MARPRPFLPFLAAALGIAVFSVMDAAMKRASLLAGVYGALLLRSVVGSLLMVPVWRFSGGRWPAWPVLKVHAVRGAVCAGMAATFFWGLVRTPMAEAIAISFIAPLIALYLAAIVLGERIRLPAILASGLGLAGVAVIGVARLREVSSSGAGWGIVSIVGSAVLYAWNLILQRQQAKLSGPAEVALFQSLFVGLSLAVLAPLLWGGLAVSGAALEYIAGAAVMAVVSLMLLSWAWGRAEAQVLLPLEYSAFIWSALMGWLMFGEKLTVPTLVGAVLIVLGCWIGTRPSAGAGAPAHIEQTAL
jgi:S-adenosylmethionine uptake transporter